MVLDELEAAYQVISEAKNFVRVRQRGATPDVETRLRATIVKLKTMIANKNTELNRLCADLPALVINQLSLENQQLREALARPDPTVISFPDCRG
ncbi:hypothetical protein [Streptomyces sp. NRRL WC-3742]|uniref:hypothetical protein n=1 Tax=Streptomyces sp. NRRL WC-3742 TaxID=1463934 RepID=UPI00068B5306|nr:hypothetical protein [Streptomyces sp. NRRL WC-3742]